MSDHLSVGETLELLDCLQQAIHEAAAKGIEIEKQFRIQTQRARQIFEKETRELESQAAEENAQADALAQAEKERILARGAARRARIGQAAKSCLDHALQEIESQEGRRKFEIQRDLLQAGRTRDAARATAEQACEQFKQALADSYRSYVALSERARASFRSYPRFQRLLGGRQSAGEPVPAADENAALEQYRDMIARADRELHRFRGFLVPLIFRLVSLPWLTLLILLGHVAFRVLGPHVGISRISDLSLGGSALACFAALFVLHMIARGQAAPAATVVAGLLERAHRLHEFCLEKAEWRLEHDLGEAEKRCISTTEELNRQWDAAVEDATRSREQAQKRIGEKSARILCRHEGLHQTKLEHHEQRCAAAKARLDAQFQERMRRLTDAYEARRLQLAGEHQALWQALTADLKERTAPLYESIDAANALAKALFPEWSAGFHERWQVPAEFAHAVRFGTLQVDVMQLSGANLPERPIELPGPSQISIPLMLAFPREGSLLIETSQSGREAALALLNNVILRLLASAPAARLSLTLVDPVGLGQSFAGITHLADYSEHLLQGRIWTQTAQVEKCLADLSDHMEKVIQVCLRNEYETITDYNAKAGSIAERYHFLVVADFPAGFSELAARRLLSIAASGARCGVFTLIHWDRRQSPPQDVVAEDLRKSSVCLSCEGEEFVLTDRPLRGTHLIFDALPAPGEVTAFIQKVGQHSVQANRIEVPFARVVPEAGDFWSQDATEELRVPIGLTGATKLQYLALGRGTRQHALIAGKTGSGKSTLFHVIITNLALWYSPEQVEFYLVDFKKGVEFKCYAAKQLPHARVVAIESDREFGLSVLQRVDEELRRRGEIFRELRVQDLTGYRKAGGTEPIPRTLLIIDEFQEFFVEDDRAAQNAAVLLDRLVRQGRAFGIHVLLGSQTLGGAYTLARTTLGQMVVRIALQCNEADAYLIMDESNAAPRLLSRPGEAIYNDTGGTLEGNSPFQTVWLPEDVRESYLDKVHELACRRAAAPRRPVVFEGNSPADVWENEALRQLLEAVPKSPARVSRIWLGAPNSIKGPTEAIFKRQSGSNLLVVGQREEAALALLSISLVALAAQYPAGAVQLALLDSSPPGSSERAFLERLVQVIPQGVTVARGTEVDGVLAHIVEEMRTRAASVEASAMSATFLFINGLQNLKRLRYEEDFGFSDSEHEAAAHPGRQLDDLICGGPAWGIHVFAICDTYNNVTRFLSRKALSEFEMRIVFQMSANDSASLIDSPNASGLGLHRAIFYNEQEGYLEVFRPYALPDQRWVREAARLLAMRGLVDVPPSPAPAAPGAGAMS